MVSEEVHLQYARDDQDLHGPDLEHLQTISGDNPDV